MTEPYKRSYPDKLSYMNTLKKTKKTIRELYVCDATIIKCKMGAVNIVPVAFSLANYEFIWTWPLIGYCEVLEGV